MSGYMTENESRMYHVQLLAAMQVIRALCMESLNSQKTADMLEEDIRGILHQIDKVLPPNDPDETREDVPF